MILNSPYPTEIPSKRTPNITRGKANGFRIRNGFMACPGRASCVFGERCHLGPDKPPLHWTACMLEIERDRMLRGHFRARIELAQVLDHVASAAHLEEVVGAYIDLDLRYQRYWRYLLGKGYDLPENATTCRDDDRLKPMGRVFNRRLNLLLYINDIIELLVRVAGSDDPNKLPRGCRRRDGSWLHTKRRAPKSNKKPSRPRPPSSKPRQRKKYRTETVRSVLRPRRAPT